MPLDQSRAPYVDAVIKYVAEHRIPFHMPGHKQGAGIDPILKALLNEDMFRYDLTEVDGLDYLNAANGVILDAEKLAAESFGAKRTFFLINGSTTGNMASILACVKENEKILVCRNAHQSTSSGVVLSGAVPIYAVPTRHPSGLYPVTGVDEIIRILEKHQDIKALHITSPTHVGLVSNLPVVISIAHEYGIPIIVDEAHGSHFVFHEKLPMSALKAGADLVIQSTHKTLGSLTQTSMLHVGENCGIRSEYIEQILQMLQSTSPSTLLVMSLDAARRQMAVNGKQSLEKTIELSEWARKEINNTHGFHCYGLDEIGKNDVADVDRTKLLIDVRHSGYTGYELEQLLGRQYHIEIEMSDPWNILCFITIGDSDQSVRSLVESLKDISKTGCERRSQSQRDDKVMQLPPTPEFVLSPKKAFFSEKTTVRLSDAKDQVCGEYIIPFPPDIPILIPGERVTAHIIEYILALKQDGVMIIGPSDKKLNTLQIVSC